MARSKLSYVAFAVLAGASSSSLGAGCLFVTDFEPIGAGGSSSATMSTSSASGTTGTETTATDVSASAGTGGTAPSCPPLSTTPFAEFDFAGEGDAIDGMVVIPSGDTGDWTYVVGHATPGSTVSFDGDTAGLEGSFVLKLDPVQGILQEPVPNSITSLRIAQTGSTVSVLSVEADKVTMQPFQADTLSPFVSRICTLSAGAFTGGALSVRNQSAAIAVTWDDPDATFLCSGNAVDLPINTQFAVMIFTLQKSPAIGEWLGRGIIPLDPSLAVREDDTSIDVCFGNRHCITYDGSPNSSDLFRGHAVMTRSVVGSIRAAGGTLDKAEPLELTQFAPGDVVLVLAEDADFAVPQGGAFGVSSNDKTVVVSGFERGPNHNGALFLKLVAPSESGEKWAIETYEDPKMSETESWGVAAATDESGTSLTGAMMYRCPNDTSPVRGAIFNAPF